MRVPSADPRTRKASRHALEPLVRAAIGAAGEGKMSLLLAAMLAAAQPAPAQPPRPDARPVDCVYDRLDRAYLSTMWLRMNDPGIRPEDPEARNLFAAVEACTEQLSWRERDRVYGLYHALARGHFALGEILP